MSTQVLPLKAFLALLVANVKVLGLTYPNAVYQNVTNEKAIELGIHAGCISTGCYYTVGEVKDGPITAGCIVGQAIAAMPEEYRIPLKEGKDVNGNTDDAYGGYHEIREIINADVDARIDYNWLSNVQFAQDNGKTWGEAIEGG